MMTFSSFIWSFGPSAELCGFDHHGTFVLVRKETEREREKILGDWVLTRSYNLKSLLQCLNLILEKEASEYAVINP